MYSKRPRVQTEKPTVVCVFVNAIYNQSFPNDLSIKYIIQIHVTFAQYNTK